jgi:hypothetical protein
MTQNLDWQKALETEIAWSRSRHPDWKFAGLAELLLAHGRVFQQGPLPARRGGWFSAKKSCFRNAFLNVDRDPSRYVYVEGYCVGDVGRFEHAWFVDRQSPELALDSTLRDERHHYLGVPLNWKYVSDTVFEIGAHCSILDGVGSHVGIYTGATPPEVFVAKL